MAKVRLTAKQKEVIIRMRNGYQCKTVYPTSKWVTFKGNYYAQIDPKIHSWRVIDSLFNKGLFYASHLTELGKTIEL